MSSGAVMDRDRRPCSSGHGPARPRDDQPRFLPHSPPAALRLRRGERDEGRGPGARRGHHRSWHGQSRRSAAGACDREARRGRPQSASPSLFGVEGHSRPAQGPGRLLCPPIRGRARSRQRGDRHFGLEGGARQSRPGDHRARRRCACAQPLLSDPPVRLHHRRRRDPLDPRRARPGLLRHTGARGPLHRAASRPCW